MYKPLSDSTLMGMTKKQIIEQLRVAEHNFFVMQDTVAQQAENVKDWIPVVRCSECKYHCEYDGYHHCRILDVSCPDDSGFFCKWGERR